MTTCRFCGQRRDAEDAWREDEAGGFHLACYQARLRTIARDLRRSEVASARAGQRRRAMLRARHRR
jgi:hypothetical protein